MTDKPTPTDAELEALLLAKLPASKHYIRPVIEKMVAAMQAAIDKWGQPAPATQQAGYAEVIECGNSYAKVKLKGEAFGSTRVGDIFYTAPQQEAQDATVAAFEAVRKELCALPRYSFVLDDDGSVCVPDRTGNWIEFDEAHALFDPGSVDAAIAAQGNK